MIALTKEEKSEVAMLVRSVFRAEQFHKATERFTKEHAHTPVMPWDELPDDTKKVLYAITDELFTVFVKLLNSEAAEAEGDLIGIDVPIEVGKLPVPTCPRCGGHCRAFYMYAHRTILPNNEGTLVMQSYCCPHASCRAILITMPVGTEVPDISTPGAPGWPGMRQ